MSALYIFTANTDSDATQVNANFNLAFSLQLETLANNVSSTNSQELEGSALKIVDKFDRNSEVSIGQAINNTIDISNTTAYYDLMNQLYSLRITYNDSTHYYSTTTSYVLKKTFSSINDTVESVAFYYKQPYSSATGYAKVEYNYSDSTTSYTEKSANDVDNYTYGISTNPNPSKTVDNIKIYLKSTDASRSMHIKNMCVLTDGIDSSSKLIQSTTTTISTSDDKILVTPLMYEELSTGDSITFDYSLDNESTWNTDNAVNTWIDASGATNTGTMSIKLNLNTNDGTTTPKVKGWAVVTSD